MLKELNKLIAERKTYGMRNVEFKSKGRGQAWLKWSNAGARWHASPATRLAHRAKDATSVALDANELLVPFKFKEVQILLELKGDRVKPLPLYSGSYEANSPRP